MNNELYEKLTKLQWLLHRQQIRSYRRGENLADGTRGQGRILAVLKLRDGMSTRDLAYLLGLRVSSLNELLFKLERSGYVTRESSEQDKRIMLVKLTEKGNSQQAHAENAADISDIFDCLTEDEQATFGKYIDMVIEALGKKLGFDVEEFEWLKSAQHERSRLFAKMHEYGRVSRGFHGGCGDRGAFRSLRFERGGFRCHIHNSCHRSEWGMNNRHI